jgi:hypothetical protein
MEDETENILKNRCAWRSYTAIEAGFFRKKLLMHILPPAELIKEKL